MDDDIFRGFDFMEQFPVLHDLVICRKSSCYDKKGGNDNGFTNKAEHIRKVGKRGAVYLDAIGPGCVFLYAEAWLNHFKQRPKWIEKAHVKRIGRVQFFFNGESEPQIDVPVNRFVGPEPFTFPLAYTPEQSTGSTVTYVPMPYPESLKVFVTGGQTFCWGLHFYYHTYPRGTQVPAWSRETDLSAARAALDYETACRPAGQIVHQLQDLVLQPGESREIFASDQGGTIKCLRMRLPEDDAAVKSLMLKAWWDDDREPSLNGPLSLFYAVENRWAPKPMAINLHAEMRGVVVGQDKEGLFFLRLPMPFSRRARLVIENRGTAAATIAEVWIESDETVTPGLGKSAGYLRTQFRESHQLTPGRDYVMAEIQGRGHIAGTVLAVEDTAECCLEGDERCYTDGGRSPLIIGDATETYFGGSWYFCEEAFALPLYGAPTFRMKSQVGGSPADITMYRFHVTDYFPFRGSARFSIQHGGFNEVPGNYRSLIFYYHLSDPSLTQTDYLSMADPESLRAHGFSAAPVRTRMRDGFFDGEFNGMDIGTLKRPKWMSPIAWMFYWTWWGGNRRRPPKDSPDRVSFTVAEHDRPHEFTVKIDPQADAVMLRRVLDQSVPDQRARIEVDGKLAGIWFNTGNNKWKIFAEDDLILDPSATRGKEKITLRVAPESLIWTAAEYTVFSIVTP
ncbi:MAG: hypothetical protein A2V67_01875 [Deltaproteobacteria bacterium RBG_13_61_14]|nr:MAG: hypothetical protein A2V67_01875 [Deltaproteobacteria bacterium RBG_13_61_14]